MTSPLPAKPTTPSVRGETRRPLQWLRLLRYPQTHKLRESHRCLQSRDDKPDFAGIPGVGVQSTKVYCSPTCRIVGGVDGGLLFVHQPPCAKGPQEPIEHVPGTPKMKKSQCKVCGLGDHTDIGDCPKFQQLVACSVEKIVKAQTASTQSPRELHFRSEDAMS